MNNTYAEARNSSLFVQGVAQYTAVGAGFFSVKGLDVVKMAHRVIDVVRFQARRRSIEAQLNAMSDHMLADIGVVRGDIPTFAREWAKNEHPAGASKKSVSLVDRVVRNVKQWARRQSIEAQLRGMSDRMLDDIGVERADIDRIVREWVEIESAPAKAKIIGPNSEIEAIVTSDAIDVRAVANDTNDVRVAS